MNALLHRHGFWFALLVLLLACANTFADVKLPAIFSDHAVLQSGKGVCVWGWADANETVSVDVAGEKVDTVTSAVGNWSVALPALKATGPQTLTVSGHNTLQVKDVLVGEVWLCAGQSNMAMPLKGAYGGVEDAAAVVAKADHPNLRMFVHDQRLTIRITTIPPDAPQTDRAGKWIVCTPKTAASFTAMGYFFARHLQEHIDTPVGLINCSAGGTDIEAWTGMPAQRAVPSLAPLLADWQDRLKGYDPIVAQTKAATAKAVWQKERDAAIKAGESAPKMPRDADYQNLTANKPAGLFNGMIAPLIPYSIRGVIWYQGEHNAGGAFTSLYGEQLQTLIQDWRVQWKDDFYFAFVQLPRYQKPQTEPSEDAGWGVWVREGERQTLAKVSNAAMAITIDLGGAGTGFTHPKNKDEFARRIALLALSDVYGKSDPLRSGPLYRKSHIENGRMMIQFDFGNGMFAASDSTKPKGFAIAGPDHKFVWANTEIHNDQVTVWSDQVPDPQSVRYDWAGNPSGDLYNAAKLPCSPFRTDAWPPTIQSAPAVSE